MHARRVEVSQGANDRYFAEMMRKRHRQIFWQDSCNLANSYYFDNNGDVPLRPASTVEAYWRSRRFPLADYCFTAQREQTENRSEPRIPDLLLTILDHRQGPGDTSSRPNDSA